VVEISVIIPAYNAEETLGACLRALQAQSVGRDSYEVIVVDDGSTDHTADTVRGSQVRLIQQANAGAGAARNAGAQSASGNLLLFTDADCTPAPDWVAQMTAPFIATEVQGAKGVYASSQRELVARFVQLEYEERYARLARYNRIDFVDTYSAAYRREVFDANAGFDPFYYRLQDQELSFRLARQGHRLVFAPRAVVSHVHDRSVVEYWRRKFEIGYWKAIVVRRHPQRAVSDSHTPQTLRAQIALLILLGPLIVLWALWPAAGLAVLAVAIAFAATALPLARRIARNDPTVLLAAPLLIIVRDLALCVGLASGFFSWWRRNSHRAPSRVAGARRPNGPRPR